MSNFALSEFAPTGSPALPAPGEGGLDQEWTRIALCLEEVLRDQGWIGANRDIIEVLPLQPKADKALELRNAAARLGFQGRLLRRGAFDAREVDRFARNDDGRITPLLSLPAGGGAAVLRPGTDGWPLPLLRDGGQLLAFERAEPAVVDGERASWFRKQLHASLPLMSKALLLTLFANLMALASPLFVMGVYDKVIAAESTRMLAFLGAGAVAAAGFEYALRRMRARVLCHASLRLGYVVGNSVFGRLLGLPSILTERAGVSSQLSRVKDIDRVRDLLGGTLGQAAMDLPFALVFLVAIAVIGGWLAVIPVAAIAVFGTLAYLGNAHLRQQTTLNAQANAKRQVVLLEMIDRMRAIRATGSGALWLERFQSLVVRSARATQRYAHSSFVLSTTSQSLGTLAALATLLAGIAEVFSQAMTTGGLIACMMMVWRLLGPVQNAFNASTRLGQLQASMQQVDGLMRTPVERTNIPHPGASAPIQGKVTFNRVTFRYGRETDPILANLSFQAVPGEILAVLGRNGGGKSTILKLVAGLYTAQGGNIRIDDRDIRQFDPIHLRRSVAYVSQVPHFFHGTLLDNLRMAAPEADGIEIIEALEKAGALDTVTMLKDGLQTRFDNRTLPLPSGLMARLSLARAYLRNAPIVLLDEPATGFDFEGEFAFIDALEHLRDRKAAVILITHRRRYIGIADKVLILENGASRYFGSADKVKDHIPKGMM